jgi:hypothetical protein
VEIIENLAVIQATTSSFHRNTSNSSDPFPFQYSFQSSDVHSTINQLTQSMPKFSVNLRFNKSSASEQQKGRGNKFSNLITKETTIIARTQKEALN